MFSDFELVCFALMFSYPNEGKLKDKEHCYALRDKLVVEANLEPDAEEASSGGTGATSSAGVSSGGTTHEAVRGPSRDPGGGEASQAREPAEPPSRGLVEPTSRMPVMRKPSARIARVARPKVQAAPPALSQIVPRQPESVADHWAQDADEAWDFTLGI